MLKYNILNQLNDLTLLSSLDKSFHKDTELHLIPIIDIPTELWEILKLSEFKETKFEIMANPYDELFFAGSSKSAKKSSTVYPNDLDYDDNSDSWMKPSVPARKLSGITISINNDGTENVHNKKLVFPDDDSLKKPISKPRKHSSSITNWGNERRPSAPQRLDNITNKFAETTMESTKSPGSAPLPLTNGSAKSIRVKTMDLNIKPAKQNPLTSPVSDVTSPTSISEKVVQAAQTIMSKFSGGPIQIPNMKIGSASTPRRSGSETPQSKPENKKWNGNSLLEYGPKYADDSVIDFQNCRIKLPVGNYFQTKLFLDIIVTGVQSPECFYIQNMETFSELDRMEKSMKEWYDGYWAENPNIDPKTIFKGCYYACYVEDKAVWYRCRVDYFTKEMNKPLKIVVQLMDHGSIAVVAQDCLLPLRKVYSKLPIQAAIATLQMVDNTIPYKTAEIRKFKEDVEGKTFQAFITEHKRTDDQNFPFITLVLLETINGHERPYCLASRSDYNDFQLPENGTGNSAKIF